VQVYNFISIDIKLLDIYINLCYNITIATEQTKKRSKKMKAVRLTHYEYYSLVELTKNLTFEKWEYVDHIIREIFKTKSKIDFNEPDNYRFVARL
jgi:hypothetical protein